jgi:hypothetical protein
LFKQMKQMKEVVAEAPDLVRNAMAMQEAQTQAAQAAMNASMPGGAASGAAVDAETIAGVSLASYAGVCRVGTERGVTDLAGVAAIAREQGIDEASWTTAMNGWNARFATDTTAAMRFNALWKGQG